MSTTTETGDTPILDTRIPEGRAVAGLEYGEHVQRDDWAGYHVRVPACTQWGIARQTPASDQLAGTDRDIAIAIAEELERHEREHFEALAGEHDTFTGTGLPVDQAVERAREGCCHE